jgi:hypothetical protein
VGDGEPDAGLADPPGTGVSVAGVDAAAVPGAGVPEHAVTSSTATAATTAVSSFLARRESRQERRTPFDLADGGRVVALGTASAKVTLHGHLLQRDHLEGGQPAVDRAHWFITPMTLRSRFD